MPLYQLRFTFPGSGRTNFFTEFEAADDAAALNAHARRAPDLEAELWCGERRIRTDGDGAAGPGAEGGPARSAGQG